MPHPRLVPKVMTQIPLRLLPDYMFNPPVLMQLYSFPHILTYSQPNKV